MFSTAEYDFRRVETILIDVARNPGISRPYPTPAGLKSKTFAAHIRFGARIWLEHKFPSPLFDLQFADLWSTVVISERLNQVIIGPRGTRYTPPAPATNGGIVQVTCHNHTPEVIDALLLLHERGIIKEATHLPNLQEADAVLIEGRIETERRNVGFAPHPVTGYIML